MILTHDITAKLNFFFWVKFAYRIDSEGHIDRVAKVSDFYTSSDVGGHSQSTELVILKVICNDVAISTNKEAVIQEKVEDDAMISTMPTQEGARETNGGCGNPVKRVKQDVAGLEGVIHKFSTNISKHNLSRECLWGERVIDDDRVHVLDDHLWVLSDRIAIRETFKSSHHSENNNINLLCMLRIYHG